MSDVTCRIDLELLRAATNGPDDRLPPSLRAPIPPPPVTPANAAALGHAAPRPAAPVPATLAETLRRVIAPSSQRPVALWKQPRALVVAAAGAVVALALGVAVMPASRGELRVEVRGGEDARAEVFVDGVKHCDVSPCIARGLKPGQHTVQVFAPGRSSQSVIGEVASGEQQSVLVSLTPPGIGSCAATAPSAPAPQAVVTPRSGDSAVVVLSPHGARAVAR